MEDTGIFSKNYHHTASPVRHCSKTVSSNPLPGKRQTRKWLQFPVTPSLAHSIGLPVLREVMCIYQGSQNWTISKSVKRGSGPGFFKKNIQQLFLGIIINSALEPSSVETGMVPGEKTVPISFTALPGPALGSLVL